ncbi:FAD-dependent oxidoreductase [Natranaerobius thermophilus]|uniref:FAD-dependent pyridine nucleotide-disulphide oxidoreductase n=1 Tax=Natranaerobius thermophilus (strain ATCC BAA-1301 / DSM 18059 / JW/NM-WN-LF) TaxID=457570 RepID=B2A5T0_NATTJ|nr:FAD-dependent oxidoreductase [Natranaerobius thermophilus]ACB84023.1 FAD-dependent pyridine nucleotide-disulphide oxidoreductase [Natranaerobius thermophilus JW/NM-WN-LF]
MAKKVIIIGGNAAGLSAASQIKRQNPHWDTIVFERTDEVSYASCGIPYYIQEQVTDSSNLYALSANKLKQDRGIDLRLHTEIMKINPEDNKVIYNSKDCQNNLLEESYDYLLIATGTSPDSKGITINSDKVFSVKYVGDGVRIKNYLKQQTPKKVAVIGGGYIALEMAESLKNLGLDTYFIHRRDQLNRAFMPDISQEALQVLEQNNVNLLLNTEVTKIEDKSNNKVAVTTESGNSLEFDMIITAIGVRPNTSFLKESGIELGVNDTIKTSRYMQTNYSNIYAAGDVAETVNLVTQKSVFSPLALKANKEGSIAGSNIAAEAHVEKFPGVLKTSILKLFNTGIARTGLTENEANQEGFNAETIVIDSPNKPGYYPGSRKLKTVIVFESKTGKLLGAQLIGPIEDAKKIDTFAVLTQTGATVDDIYHLDLSYAPPFSPVYDPVVLAGRVARKQSQKS